MMPNHYTVATASSFAGVDRKTVLNALKNEALTASKTTKNHWVISHNNLKKWMKSRGKPHSPHTITSEDKKPSKTVPDSSVILRLSHADAIQLRHIILDNLDIVNGRENLLSRENIDFSNVEHMECLFIQAKLLKYITQQLEIVEPEGAQ
tara:strand:+ start:482 stop:931 length:450 start_codon:yes stop_codon:yes gene_type:complete